MADQDARALLLTIQANTELLRSNLSAAERSIEEFTKKTEAHLDESDARFELFGKSLERLEGPLERLKGLGEFALGAALGESLVETGKNALEFAGNVKFVSEQVGTGTDFLQKYRFAAGQFGVGNAEADAGLTKFARSIGGAANGNKQLIEVFDRLGVKVRDAGGNVRSVESVFLDTADAIQKIDNPAQKTADALALMGRGAAGLKPLLSQGAAGFSELAAQAQALGVVLSPELIEHSESVNHKLAALKAIVTAQMAAAITQNAGAIEGLASAFVKAAGAVSQFLAQHPERALGLLGFVTGLKVGGAAAPEAAIALGAAGYFYGNKLKQDDDNSNGDLDFRREQLQQANEKVKADRRLRAQSGGSLVDPKDYSADVSELQRQLSLFTAARKAPHHENDNLGSTGAGATNDSGKDLADAKEKLGQLEELRAHATGAALAGINEEIVQQKRKITFIKQGADAELANSLASKQGSAEKAGETAAKRAARKAEEDRLKTLGEDRAYEGQIVAADQAIARAREKLADSPEARFETAVQELRDGLSARNKQLDDDVAAGKRTAPQAALLRVKLGSAEELGEQDAAKTRGDQADKETLDAAQAEAQRRENILQIQDQLATTAKQRRDIELRLLQLAEDQERAALEYQRDHARDQGQRSAAQAALDALPEQYAARRQQTIANTRGPGEQYLHDIDSKDLNEQLQGVKVGGLDSLDNSLTGIVSGTTKVSSAFKSMTQSIISDLARIAIEQEIIKPLANSLFGGDGSIGGTGGGGIFASIAHLFGGGKATGGDVSDTKFYVVGENGPEIFAPGRSGTIIPNHAIAAPRAILAPNIPSARQLGEQRAQATHVQIAVAANDYFDAKVSSISSSHVQQAAPRIASGGAQLAEANAARARRRTIPS